MGHRGLLGQFDRGFTPEVFTVWSDMPVVAAPTSRVGVGRSSVPGDEVVLIVVVVRDGVFGGNAGVGVVRIQVIEGVV